VAVLGHPDDGLDLVGVDRFRVLLERGVVEHHRHLAEVLRALRNVVPGAEVVERASCRFALTSQRAEKKLAR
jgi:hypothetical protein